MFQFYGRSETSFVCSVPINTQDFKWALQARIAMMQRDFCRRILEDEFVLAVEVDKKGRPTGRDVALFVVESRGELVLLESVTGDLEEFWRKQKSEATNG